MINFDIRKELPISLSAKALQTYAENFEKAYSLKKDVAIFLDTNVLLSYYGMAASEKTKLLSFLKDNSSHIYLTAQVQEEFRRNRVKNIEKDLFEPLRKIPDSFVGVCDEITNKFEAVLHLNKKILVNDYPEEWRELEKVRDELNEVMSIQLTLDKLKARISETTNDFKDVKIKDELLFTCASLNTTEKLSEGEISGIEKLYAELLDAHKNSNQSTKPYTVFPGAGDSKGKEYPYGDFIIYHEILKFIKAEAKHAVFLTNEKSKGDWIADDFSPHVHYIEHTYSLTDQIIFILNAEKPLSLSLANIHQTIEQPTNLWREAVVTTIDHEKGYGFVFNDGETYYFNVRSFMDDADFYALNKQDYLRFNLTSTPDGRVAAVLC
ncbi:PIN-like domain-containing protein [Pseudomonas fluorescens]|uniref:PIN-like domain-containing protein n=1 Tax=Pseudomonas fluorescens TaxID=294 RepID=UPI003526BAAF